MTAAPAPLEGPRELIAEARKAFASDYHYLLEILSAAGQRGALQVAEERKRRKDGPRLRAVQ